MSIFNIIWSIDHISQQITQMKFGRRNCSFLQIVLCFLVDCGKICPGVVAGEPQHFLHLLLAQSWPSQGGKGQRQIHICSKEFFVLKFLSQSASSGIVRILSEILAPCGAYFLFRLCAAQEVWEWFLHVHVTFPFFWRWIGICVFQQFFEVVVFMLESAASFCNCLNIFLVFQSSLGNLVTQLFQNIGVCVATCQCDHPLSWKVGNVNVGKQLQSCFNGALSTVLCAQCILRTLLICASFSFLSNLSKILADRECR